jgi:hypothetical protein
MLTYGILISTFLVIFISKPSSRTVARDRCASSRSSSSSTRFATLAAYVAYVSIRQHADVSSKAKLEDRCSRPLRLIQISIRQHTSAYVSIRQHTSAYVSIRQHTLRATGAPHSDHQAPRLSSPHWLHTSAYVSIRQHTSAYVARDRCASSRSSSSSTRFATLAAYVAYVSMLTYQLAYADVSSSSSTLYATLASFAAAAEHTSAYASIRQHTSAYVSIRQHTPACAPQHSWPQWRRHPQQLPQGRR